jgi:uncharacterized protein
MKKLLLIVMAVVATIIVLILIVHKLNTNLANSLGNGEVVFVDGEAGNILGKISVGIADNEDKRAKGLMGRRSMPENAGMLFVFDKETVLSFWMKDTYLPLDMIFVDDAFEIVNIVKNTKPLDKDIIPSVYPGRYVVETNAGFSDRNGIKIGDKISISIFLHPRR